MSIQLKDDTGEIRGTFFKDDIDVIGAKLERGKVYRVTGGRLRPTNPQYNPLQGPRLEILFFSATTFEDVNDPTAGQAAIRMVTIDELETLGEDLDPVSFCAVVVRADEAMEISTEAGLRKRREIVLADETGKSVEMTLLDGSVDLVSESDLARVFIFVGLYRGECQGKMQVSMGNSSAIWSPEAHDVTEDLRASVRRLEQWWSEVGSKIPLVPVLSADNAVLISSTTSFCEILTQPMIGEEQANWDRILILRGVYQNSSYPYYEACSNEECGWKSLNEHRQCPKCQRQYEEGENGVWRWKLKLEMADGSGGGRVGCFGGAELPFGDPSNEERREWLWNNANEFRGMRFLVKGAKKRDQRNGDDVSLSTSRLLTPNWGAEALRILDTIADRQ